MASDGIWVLSMAEISNGLLSATRSLSFSLFRARGNFITKLALVSKLWADVFKKIGIVSRLDNEEALRLASEVYRSILRMKLIAVPEEELARARNLSGGTQLKDMDVDMIVSIGGDGTVLKTSMLMPKPETPLMAVNMGRRGYLADVEPENALKAISACVNGRCRTEKRMKLKVTLDGVRPTEGLNEVLVAPSLPYKMLDLHIEVGGYALPECRADGFIVATPTGSTAHAFSAGGPILDPGMDACVLAFICPVEQIHPVVVGADKNICIRLTNSNQASIIIDGRARHELKSGSKVTISKSDHRSFFLRYGGSKIHKNLLRFPLAEIESESAGT